MINHKNTQPLKEGHTRYEVIYEGYGVKFSTEIDDFNESAATNQFKKFYPRAIFISIKQKT